MNQETINRFVDNLDVNTQADLLKKILFVTYNYLEIKTNLEVQDAEGCVEDLMFIEKQVNEFNEQYSQSLEIATENSEDQLEYKKQTS